MIFFDVKMDGTTENISQVVPSKRTTKENGQKIMKVASAVHKEKRNMESLPELIKPVKQHEGEDERFIKDWQAIAKILGGLLFIMNIISFAIAFGYGYTILYTY